MLETVVMVHPYLSGSTVVATLLDQSPTLEILQGFSPAAKATMLAV